MVKGAITTYEKDFDQLNLTSMTDILMTLLCFFMVLETAQAISGFNMNLPKVVSVEAPENPTVLISYSAKRKLFVTTNEDGDVIVQRERLAEHLARLRKQRAYDNIVIKANKALLYKEIIGIMDDAKRAGFDKISLATGM